ncbi:ABC transporter substrate-binding protein [Desulfosporosinus shakirovi]|uniref:ABC transporter substrate-binding protein n=1 Tax=Desulfosporosinus shakirovi TaxID=2885154 RepID=UPI001E550858|nr:NrtA/SsuA/CpmA family ABC transporter substrate-binding protein [Desulfosporosinus sp. SRJS8]MCB8817569.1 NrtA/SsuA/CpmA family ABC transporter substrate-binding protein [Desulfosporosinus sp. SRJS8]
MRTATKFAGLIMAVMLLALTGCSAEKPAASQSFKVGTWKTAQTIQPFYYGDYLPASHTVEVLPFTNPGDQKTALLAGDLDMCGTTWVTAISAASKGEPVKVVANLTNKCSALVVGADSGINNVADLKDKKIAYVPGTMHQILLLEALKRAGRDPGKDVTLVQIDFFDMGQALANKQIDAFCSGEPYPSIAVTTGYGKILEYPYYDDSIGYLNGAILSTEKEIKDNPQGIQALVDAHAKATEYLRQNKDAWLSKAAEFGTDKAVLEEASGNMELAWNITPAMVRQVKNLAQRMCDLGIIKEIPDIEAMINLQFVQNVKS